MRRQPKNRPNGIFRPLLAQKKRKSQTARRTLRLESLESRQMLSAVPWMPNHGSPDNGAADGGSGPEAAAYVARDVPTAGDARAAGGSVAVINPDSMRPVAQGGGSIVDPSDCPSIADRIGVPGEPDLEHGPGLHDSVHCIVGGTMCSARSSNDPIFFTSVPDVDFTSVPDVDEILDGHAPLTDANDAANFGGHEGEPIMGLRQDCNNYDGLDAQGGNESQISVDTSKGGYVSVDTSKDSLHNNGAFREPTGHILWNVSTEIVEFNPNAGQDNFENFATGDNLRGSVTVNFVNVKAAGSSGMDSNTEITNQMALMQSFSYNGTTMRKNDTSVAGDQYQTDTCHVVAADRPYEVCLYYDI
ncbi:MAG: hypothetical protein VB835_16605 [Pirellulales bacterium]